MVPRMAAGVLAVALLVVAGGRPPVAEGGDAPDFSNEQLDAMVAPIALYPDELLAQIFMASTYPLEVVEADRWRSKEKGLSGEALEKALAEKDWEESVEWLTHFPDVLGRMSSNLEWTQDLGDAFLGQREGLMDAVQRMRARAADAGTLKTTEQQTVIREKETIRIESAQPQVVYVPTYPPAQAYGTWAAPPAYYPAVMAPPPAYTAGTALLSFGVGMATGALVASAFDWDDHDVYVHHYGGGGYGHGHGNVNVNKNVNINQTNVNAKGDRWQHDASHRRNVRYRDDKVGERYAGRDRTGTREQQRDRARGVDRERAGAEGRDRDRAGQGRPDRPGGEKPGRPDRPAPADRQARAGGQDRPGRTERPGGGGDRKQRDRPQGALGGYGNGRQEREASARGAASRGQPSFAGKQPASAGARAGGGRPGGGQGMGGGHGGGGGGRGGGGGGGGRGGGGGGGGRGGGGGGRGGGRGR